MTYETSELDTLTNWQESVHALVDTLNELTADWTTFYLTWDGPDEFLVEEHDAFAGQVTAEYTEVEALELVLTAIEEGPNA